MEIVIFILLAIFILPGLFRWIRTFFDSNHKEQIDAAEEAYKNAKNMGMNDQIAEDAYIKAQNRVKFEQQNK